MKMSEKENATYLQDGNLYVAGAEWGRLCKLESPTPVENLLESMRDKFLLQGKSVRLVSEGGDGIYISADSSGEFQRLVDDANDKRKANGLGPVVPKPA